MGKTELPWKVYRCSYVDEMGQPGTHACGIGNAQDERAVVHDWAYDECHHPLTIDDAEFIVEACNSYASLKAENERLREALESVAGLDCVQYDKFLSPEFCGVCISCEAREALSGGKG